MLDLPEPSHVDGLATCADHQQRHRVVVAVKVPATLGTGTGQASQELTNGRVVSVIKEEKRTQVSVRLVVACSYVREKRRPRLCGTDSTQLRVAVPEVESNVG